jgi:predicted AlkP superfamily phosphohydrolase/phosphomutase/tetratricopeptide (TPR) repeat protein
MTKVLFIGWDAADWKAIHPLMDAGKMPNLQKLVEGGAMGRVATLQPPLSPMLWTSIATGKRPFKHGIHGFSEPVPDGRSVQPITNLSRTSKAIWNILNQNGKKSVVVGWWPSHPAEPINGVTVSDHYHKAHRKLGPDGVAGWPLLKGAVHPPELHDTIAELRMHPQELAGPMLLPFLPALEKIDQKKDRRFSMLCKTISECVSIHSAATWLIDNQDWDFFAVYYDAIDHFCHGFMQYHPPKQPWVSDEDFEKYSNVVNTAYEFHDQMLGTLLAKARAKAGEELHVVLMSDHGFHPDHLRPRAIPDMPAGPAIEHSPLGIFVINGPGIKKDASLYGVSVLDATPTLLALFGLPRGDDMDGRVVTAAFEKPPRGGAIPSWEDVPGDDGRHPPHTRLDPVAAAEALEQLVALGYIEKPGENATEYVEHTVRELRYNLLEAYQDANRHPEALEIARDLCKRDPDEQRYAVKRFTSCQALGLTAEMREIVDDMTGRRRKVFEEAVEQMNTFRDLVKQRVKEAGETDEAKIDKAVVMELHPNAQPDPDEPHKPVLTPEERKEMVKWRNLRRYQPVVVDYLQAQALTAEKKWDDALTALHRVRAVHMARPGLLLHAAELYRRLNRLEESEQTYRAALEIDPDNVQANVGLCRLAIHRRAFAEAAEFGRQAVAKLYFFPMAHFLLGVARVGLKDYEAAASEFRTALSQNPHFPQAHLWLGRLLRNRFDDILGAYEHFSMYREMRAFRLKQQQRPKEAASAKPAESKRSIVDQPPIKLGPLGDDVLVVSGLPRSGTSMLMQMLHAGGLPVLTDGTRQADEDNPKGYFEFEEVKKMLQDRDGIKNWVANARCHAVKVVVPLVNSLPPGPKYRVVLLERDPDAILASQAKMIVRRGEAVQDTPERRNRLRAQYARLMEQTHAALKSRPDVQLLTLRYEEIVRVPAAAAEAINQFVGDELDVSRIASAVDASLHRNRQSAVVADEKF